MPGWRLERFDPQEALRRVEGGECHAHAVIDGGKIIGAYITHFETYTGGQKSLFVDAFAGRDFLAWKEACFEYLEVLGYAESCDAIEYVGRKGFARLDPSYEEDGRIYVKTLRR